MSETRPATDGLRIARPLRGISYRIAASLLIVVYSALVKLVTDRMPVGEIYFARAVAGVILVLVWAAWAGQFGPMVRTERFAAHIGRTAVTGFAIICVFLSLAYLPLADATAIQQTSPLFLVVLAALILGERIGIYRWGAVALGLGGMLLIVSNYVGFQTDEPRAGNAIGVLFGLLSALGYAFAGVVISTLTRFEHVMTITFYFSVFSSLVALLTLPFGWVVPTFSELAILVTMGITAGTGQIFLTQSLRYADASLVAPFDYLMLVWALLIGAVLFGQFPAPTVLIGAAIVGLAGLIVIFRQRHLQRKRA